MKPLKLLTLLLIMHFGAKAQYYVEGQDPASVKWQQIDTKKFRVIFPKGYEGEAKRMTSILEYGYGLAGQTLKSKPQKISILLHNQTVRSNAFVVWAPKRIEFYTTPPQGTYSQEWLEQLAIHEYRHVIQMEKLNQGITGTLASIFGEHVTGASSGLFVPAWFFEGDATATETALTKAGRGREPSFQKDLKAHLLTEEMFSYDKAILGSYRHIVPDEYVLGYHLVAYGREKYGVGLWDRVMNDVARKPYLFNPFSISLRKQTGLGRSGFYKAAMRELDSIWRAGDLGVDSIINKKVLNPERKVDTDYLCPQYVDDSTVIAYKIAFNDITRIVKISGGKEKIIATPGYVRKDALSYGNGTVAWAETINHPRWEHRSYSVIKTLDIKTGKKRQLTRKTRYFAPAVSPDGKKIAVVETSTEGVNRVVILAAKTGDVIAGFNTPGNAFPISPSWADDNRTVVLILLGPEGKSIDAVETSTGYFWNILSPTVTEISKPIFYKNYIIFSGAFNGTDNLYAVGRKSGDMFKITSSRFGASSPSVFKDSPKLAFSDYTVTGYVISELMLEPEKWTVYKVTFDNIFPLAEAVSDQEPLKFNSSEIPIKDYTVKPYSKWLNMFNLHSWAPASINANTEEAAIGASIMSQDILSTTIATLGYEYNNNDRVGHFYADVSYQGLFPVLDFSWEDGEKAGYYQNSSGRYTWNQSQWSLDAGLPLYWFIGKYHGIVYPKVGFSRYMVRHNPSTPESLIRGGFQLATYRLLLFRQIKSNFRDIGPRWYQSIELNYEHSLFGGNDFGEAAAIEGRLYFPGLLRHHSLNFYSGYQRLWNADYGLQGFVNYPRGYAGLRENVLLTSHSNYAFPVCYTDLSISSLIYIKRIKAAVFYDYAKGQASDNNWNYYTSYGGEVIGDMHLLRFYTPVNIGVRGIYLPDEKNTVFEFIFNMSFK